MSARTSNTQIRLNSIRKYLSLATPLLDELCDAFGSPLLKAISTITLSLWNEAESIKRNKDDCIELMEQVNTILCAIIDFHVKSDNGGVLSPATLEHLGEFTITLHKVYTFVQAQQDASRIKHFLHQNATKTLLKECKARLRHALEVFKVQHSVDFLNKMNEMQKEINENHQAMMTLITSTTSTRASSMMTGPDSR
ncbi:hypothetical protein MVEN_02278900 [Mycena venus]|uniref:Mixed lineage kinase domain-containing protein n=1 Tax=Mycena venus TaxID=2733690 RepID=A0A8H7CEC6_9AGAR|nr:hypothetical protein MVEN_02278900 [Mycena venus]